MQNKKRKILVLTLVTTLLLSSAPIFSSAASPEKVRVIIGFHGTIKPKIIKDVQGEMQNTLDEINAIVAMIPTNAIQGLQHNPQVRYVEEDKYVRLVQAQTLPWGIDRIDAEKVWSFNTGAGVAIAIVDTGIDYDHPDLAGNYWKGESFVDYTNDPMDDNGHGTHCAGIAASVDNTDGVVGVAHGAYLIAAKVLNQNGGAQLSWIADGIIWAADNGADVISLSIGYDQHVESWQNACDYAYYTKGCVVVASAGNSGNPPGRGDNVEYPARYASVIAVSATDSNDKRARWSSTGPDVELAAPGVDIYSTLWDDTYGYKSGTSMSCPHVSGVAALVLAGTVDPSYDSDNDGVWDNNEVRSKMDDTAEDLGDAGRDSHYGYGLVDAEAATSVPLEHDVAVTALDVPSSVLQGDTATIQVTAKNLGTNAETFDLTVTDETYGEFTETRSITLAAGGSTVETFTWDTTGATLGDHTIKAEAILTGDEDLSNNAMTATITVNEQGQQSDMWVSDISWRIKQAGPNTFLYHTVTVMSNDGPVSSATVYSTLDGPGGTWYYSGSTDSNGQIEFSLRGAGSGKYTATVTDISHASYTYNSALDMDNPSTYTV
jgi:subtilisin family serine protease